MHDFVSVPLGLATEDANEIMQPLRIGYEIYLKLLAFIFYMLAFKPSSFFFSKKRVEEQLLIVIL